VRVVKAEGIVPEPITVGVGRPSGPIRPSDADLTFFPRTGRYHLIIGYPYQKNNWRCFTADGKPHELEVIA
jgi:proteasome lid subunit RPN8/RPN11